MHDAGAVHGLEGVGELVGQLEEVPGVERPAGVDLLLEGGALDELGDDEGVRAVELGVQDAGDGRVAQALQRGGLAAQPFAGRGVVEVAVQHLEGDGVAAVVQGTVDGAHGAGPDLVHDRVTAQLRTGSGAGAGRGRDRRLHLLHEAHRSRRGRRTPANIQALTSTAAYRRSSGSRPRYPEQGRDLATLDTAQIESSTHKEQYIAG